MISIDKLSFHSPLESVKKESVYEIGNMPRLYHCLKNICLRSLSLRIFDVDGKDWSSCKKKCD